MNLPLKASSVSPRATRNAILLNFYHQYLSDGDTARFMATVAKRYCVSTLQRLLETGDICSRRAAALSLGLLADSRSLPVLGPLLCDSDRKLRLVVDDSMRAISSREGSSSQQQMLEQIVRANECQHFERAIDLATKLLETGSGISEVYHQRSLAFFQVDSLEYAIDDCRQALKLNRYHYAAMIGLGHCHLELGDLLESLFWFRRALDIYPDLEPVRIQVRRLEKTIQGL